MASSRNLRILSNHLRIGTMGASANMREMEPAQLPTSHDQSKTSPQQENAAVARRVAEKDTGERMEVMWTRTVRVSSGAVRGGGERRELT